MRQFLFFFLFLTTSAAFPQSVSEINFYDHIAPIIHKNCTPCHQPNKSGPFNLITYEDITKRARFISKVTQSRYMPPFPADRKFQSYLNERSLTVGEITTIQLWIEGGMKEGTRKPQQETKPITATEETTPDLVLKMQPYAIAGNNSEDFRFFSLPTNLPDNKYITSIEFSPGTGN